jgi:hypothetical protein
LGSSLPLEARHKSLSAHRTLDTLKVNAPHFCGRDHLSTFRAYRIERRPHFFEIDLPPKKAQQTIQKQLEEINLGDNPVTIDSAAGAPPVN